MTTQAMLHVQCWILFGLNDSCTYSGESLCDPLAAAAFGAAGFEKCPEGSSWRPQSARMKMLLRNFVTEALQRLSAAGKPATTQSQSHSASVVNLKEEERTLSLLR